MGQQKFPSMYTAIIKHNAPWWSGWIVEIAGVNAQENSRDKLMESLRVALGEAIEMNRELALHAAGLDYTEVEITL